MRLPRAEDQVIVFISVDGVPLRAEGVISRVTLEARTHLIPGIYGTVDNSIRGAMTIELSQMRPVESLEERDAAGEIVTLIVPESRP